MEVNTPVTCSLKCERNKLTKSAHRILDYVENQTNHWLLQLVDVVPTVDTLADAKHNIGHIQTTFDNVKRDVQSVHVRKASIGHKLSQLQSRLVDLHCLYPSVDNKPLLFNSGTYFLVYRCEYCTEIILRPSL